MPPIASIDEAVDVRAGPNTIQALNHDMTNVERRQHIRVLDKFEACNAAAAISLQTMNPHTARDAVQRRNVHWAACRRRITKFELDFRSKVPA